MWEKAEAMSLKPLMPKPAPDASALEHFVYQWHLLLAHQERGISTDIDVLAEYALRQEAGEIRRFLGITERTVEEARMAAHLAEAGRWLANARQGEDPELNIHNMFCSLACVIGVRYKDAEEMLAQLPK
jgi:hypothetical protein